MSDLHNEDKEEHPKWWQFRRRWRTCDPRWKEPLTVATLWLVAATLILGAFTLAFIIATDEGTKKSIEAAKQNMQLSNDIVKDETRKSLEQARLNNADAITAAATATGNTIRAANRNTEKTVQAEIEDRVLPIVMLASQDDTKATKNTIVIRNVGFGPALNVFTTSITVATAKVPTIKPCPCEETEAKRVAPCVDFYHDLLWDSVSKVAKATIHLNHRTAIAAGDTQDIAGTEDIDGESAQVQLTRDMCAEPYKRVTPIKHIEALLAGVTSQNAKTVCIGYQDALEKWHETRQMIYLTSQNELAIDFVSKRKVPNRVTPWQVCEGKR